MEQLDDEFVKSGNETIEVHKARLQYNALLKYFSEELGLPIQKYINNIRSISRKMGIPEEEI